MRRLMAAALLATTLGAKDCCVNLEPQVDYNGDYRCTGQNGQKASATLSDGRLVLGNRSFVVKNADENGFSLFSGTRDSMTDGSGRVSGSTLKLDLATTTELGSGIHSEKESYDCAKSADSSTSTTRRTLHFQDVKGVFIRPCQGGISLYKSFGSFSGKRSTQVGGGTLQSVCSDLINSGVTDVFIAFKADDPKSAPECGKAGDLLYQSDKFGNNESNDFKTAFAAGFDPIQALMNTCRNMVHTKFPMRFHAWVPIFQDAHAANIAGLAGRTSFLWFLRKENADCTSKVFANPKNDAVRQYELDVLAEIVAKYPDIVGINLDYIRYPDLSDFQAEVGAASKECKDADFEVDSDAIRSFIKTVQEIHSRKVISADVMASEGHRMSVGQEAIIAYLDIVMPMEYPSFYTNTIHDLKSKYPEVGVVPDLRGWISGSQSVAQFLSGLKEDVIASKSEGADGYSIFTYESLLAQGTQSKKKLNGIKKQIGF